MAIAGSMTTAYRLTPGLRPDAVHVDRTTYPSDRCTPPAVAAEWLRNWTPDSRPVIVQGSDMAAFWVVWNASA